MKKKFYLPVRLADRVIWLNKFALNLPSYAATFGITPAEVAAVQAWAIFYAWLVSYIDYIGSFKKSVTQFKNVFSVATIGTPLGSLPTWAPAVMPPMPTDAGIFTLIGGLARRIKANKTLYNDTIGNALGIVGDEWTFDPDAFVPSITAEVLPDSVKLVTEKEQTEATNFYGSIDGGPWVLLGRDNEPPYVDTRPVQVPGRAETRRYKCRGVMHDIEIGHESLIITVTFGGPAI